MHVPSSSSRGVQIMRRTARVQGSVAAVVVPELMGAPSPLAAPASRYSRGGWCHLQHFEW
jgi:hypothetical protein